MKCGALPLTVTMPTTALYIKQNVYTTVKTLTVVTLFPHILRASVDNP